MKLIEVRGEFQEAPRRAGNENYGGKCLPWGSGCII